MTVRRNIAFGLKIAGRGGKEIERAGRRDARAHPHGRVRRSATRTSSPAASSSASPSPAPSPSSRAALLLDEPLSALDAKIRVKLRDDIRDDPAQARHHHDLRHPRPGGGPLDLRPSRGDEGRAASSRSARPSRSTTGPPRPTSPPSSARSTCSRRAPSTRPRAAWPSTARSYGRRPLRGQAGRGAHRELPARGPVPEAARPATSWRAPSPSSSSSDLS